MFHVPIWCPHVKLIPRVLLHSILYPAVARLPFMSPGLPSSGASFFVQRQVRKASDTQETGDETQGQIFIESRTDVWVEGSPRRLSEQISV